MKVVRIILFAGLAVAIVGAVAGLLIARNQKVQEPGHRAANDARSVATSSPTATALKVAPSAVTSQSAETAQVVPPEKPDTQTNSKPQKATTQTENGLMYNGYQVQDPTARAALYFVGADPDANAYWENAIFDPHLPAEERKDLIEDLNETGLADPHHPSPADLPLILARIQLIDQLVPYSMDQVDANAFVEAHKDLVGMANGQAPH